MRTKAYIAAIIVLAAASQGLLAQKVDANQVLEKVKNNFAKIQDYRVNIKVKIDVDFLKVPESEAELLWKQPNKVKINSDGFAMMPKQTMNFSPQQFLSANYTGIYERDETIDNRPCYVIKVVPMGENSEVLLSTLWVDKSTSIVRKVESTMKNSGTSTIAMFYDDNFAKQYPLPSKVVFSFDISKGNLPKTMNGHGDDDSRRRGRGKLTKGSVEIIYSNYKVNTGLSNSLFEDKKLEH